MLCGKCDFDCDLPTPELLIRMSNVPRVAAETTSKEFLIDASSVTSRDMTVMPIFWGVLDFGKIASRCENSEALLV
jgi:hypothetical protein